jgi:chondroitin AC lyase
MRLGLIAVAGALALACRADEASPLKDVETIRQRIVAESHADKPNLKAALGLAGAQKPDGSWDGINYDAKDRAIWAPMAHLERLLALAVAFESGRCSEPERAAVSQAFVRGLDYWAARDPKSSNWWYNEIGAPLELYRMLLLAEPLLTDGRKERSCKLLERAKLGMTGQNLLWLAEGVIGRACLQRDPALLSAAFKRIQDEIVVTEKEGVQPDYSFHQHGAQLYNGGYGSGFAASAPRFALLAQGTSFAFAQQKLDILTDYLLDGQQWMIRGGTFDYSASGRELSRPNSGGARGYAGRARTLLKLDAVRRRDELERMALRLERGASAESPALAGLRHYWRSDYTVFHCQAFMASVRMTSERLLQTELVNDENQLGVHLSDGVMYLYAAGEEYRNIFPVWDWARLPGITVEHDRPLGKVKNGRRGTRAFVGGVSDGALGAAAMDFERDGLVAKKAWFFADGAAVCLGAGICATNGYRVITSINQCLAGGPVTVRRADGAVSALESPERLASPAWVHHAGFVYAFLGGGESVGTGVAEQQGDWRRISAARQADPVALQVFSLWLNHGKSPANASYAYWVAAAGSAEAAAAAAAAGQARVLSNTPQIQAVEHLRSGAVQAAFYRAGEVRSAVWGTVSADAPCLLSLRRSEGRAVLAVSDPAGAAKRVTVSARGVRQAIDLPEGARRGASVVVAER